MCECIARGGWGGRAAHEQEWVSNTSNHPFVYSRAIKRRADSPYCVDRTKYLRPTCTSLYASSPCLPCSLSLQLYLRLALLLHAPLSRSLSKLVHPLSADTFDTLLLVKSSSPAIRIHIERCWWSSSAIGERSVILFPRSRRSDTPRPCSGEMSSTLLSSTYRMLRFVNPRSASRSFNAGWPSSVSCQLFRRGDEGCNVY